MKARDRSKAVLKLKEINETEEILGVLQAPINDGKEQTKALTEKVTKWAKVFQEAKWKKSNAMRAVNTRIMKGIEYPLVATTLTRAQCRKIQRPLVQAIKRALQIQRRLSPEIMHRATEEMGPNVEEVYHIQGRRRLMHIANNAHKEESTGILIRAAHQALILETGIQGNIFEKDHEIWKHCVEPVSYTHLTLPTIYSV